MRILCFLGLLAAIAGCAQNPKPDQTGAPPATVLAFTPATPGEVVEPARLALSGESITMFRAMGEEQGTLRVTRAEDGARQWKVTHTTRMADRRPAERIVTLVELDDGSLAMSREENRAERVIVEFIPPLVVYPARLEAGAPLEQSLRMVVHPINNPSRVQNQGEAKQTLRFEGRERIDTPLGTLETVKISGALEADLGGPQVRNESQEWLVPGMGAVASKQMERTMLLGVRVRANSEWWVIDHAGADDAQPVTPPAPPSTPGS